MVLLTNYSLYFELSLLCSNYLSGYPFPMLVILLIFPNLSFLLGCYQNYYLLKISWYAWFDFSVKYLLCITIFFTVLYHTDFNLDTRRAGANMCFLCLGTLCHERIYLPFNSWDLLILLNEQECGFCKVFMIRRFVKFGWIKENFLIYLPDNFKSLSLKYYPSGSTIKGSWWNLRNLWQGMTSFRYITTKWNNSSVRTKLSKSLKVWNGTYQRKLIG